MLKILINQLEVNPWELSRFLYANIDYDYELSLTEFVNKLRDEDLRKSFLNFIIYKYDNNCINSLIANAIVRYIGTEIYYITNKREFFKNCHLLFYQGRIVCQGGCRYEYTDGDDQPNVFINNTQQFRQTEIIIDNYIYKTDLKGRTVIIEEFYPYGHYKDRDEQRGTFSKLVIEQGGFPGTDHGGHLVANQIGGLSEAINIVPMPKDFNCGRDWLDMENSVSNIIKGEDIFQGKIETTVEYKDESSHLPRNIIKKIFNADGLCLKEWQFVDIY